MPYPILRLRRKEEKRLLAGHLWAFSNELVEVPRDIAPGTVITLAREDGTSIGNAFYNPHSLIAARMLTRNASETIDDSFFRKRIAAAANRRALLYERRNALRLVHGESDFLPGLIVDRFNDVLSFQSTSAGMEAHKDGIVEILKELFSPRAIVEKNVSNLRKLEGLPNIAQIVFGDNTRAEITDTAGTLYGIDVLEGQKTGFYLDQMDNRTRLRDFIAAGDSVLDLFSNEGGFALNAALAGADRVTAVDVSKTSLEHVIANANLNGVQNRIATLEADVFDYLRAAGDNPVLHDVVVLDPPALAKSRRDIATARKAYVALNASAMKQTRPDGVLVSCSCSHHVPRELLLEVIRESSRKARRGISVLEERGAGIDHPVLAAMPETSYLKVFILRVH
jgi:23S rRNA (cytosine1962-C5)-methyltransferase